MEDVTAPLKPGPVLDMLGEVGNTLDDLVMTPAAQDCLVKCRITRDRKGMDRGLFPTYFLHMERDDGKKVKITKFHLIFINNDLFYA